MKNNLLLIAAQNTGSSFISHSIYRAGKDIKYWYEFFEPYCTKQEYKKEINYFQSRRCLVCDQKYTDILITKLILNDIYHKTWLQTDLNFTKEINIFPFFSDFFVEKFDCFGLIRNIENSFPPQRKDVYLWYNNKISYIKYNRDLITSNKIKFLIDCYINDIEQWDNQVNKSLMIFHIYQQLLLIKLKEHNIPILRYENLMSTNKNKLKIELKKIEHLSSYININKLSDIIFSKKKKYNRDFSSLGFNPKTYLEQKYGFYDHESI